MSKDISEFYLRSDGGRQKTCKKCYCERTNKYKKDNVLKIKNNTKQYYKKNKENLSKYRKSYYENNKDKEYERNRKYAIANKEKLNEYYQSYRDDNKEKMRLYYKEYRIKNKNTISVKQKNYSKARKIVDPKFKLRSRLSTAICIHLKENNGSKNNKSIISALPYSIEDLKIHLEKQFEPWMNWFNYGSYKISSWDDNDQSTWTWQIDHIIPHSTFKYTSIDDDSFKNCWALENLRPLSAKQNILDGVCKIRHKG
jgi:hypothetical protein